MALPLIPLAVVGGIGALSTSTFFGLRARKPDEITNNSYQTTIQKDYITKTSNFDFRESFWQSGSVFSPTSEITTKKEAKQTAEQVGKIEQDKSILPLLIALGVAGVGAYMVVTK